MYYINNNKELVEDIFIHTYAAFDRANEEWSIVKLPHTSIKESFYEVNVLYINLQLVLNKNFRKLQILYSNTNDIDFCIDSFINYIEKLYEISYIYGISSAKFNDFRRNIKLLLESSFKYGLDISDIYF